MRFTWPLVVFLAVVHFGLALAYSSLAPWRTAGLVWGHYYPDLGAPDEMAHTNYVRDLLAAKALPNFDPKLAKTNQTYENHQSPFAYFVLASAASLSGHPNVEDPGARWPLRIADALIGSTTVFAVFLLALWATHRSEVAIGSAAIASFLPMNAFLSGAVSNDPALIALSTFALASGVRARSIDAWGPAVSLAILSALAFWTKASALILLLTFPFFVRDRLKLAGAVTLWAALIFPLALRNQSLYGDPVASGVFRAAFPTEIDPSAFHSLKGIGLWTYTLVRHAVESTIGIFGYMDIHLPKIVAWPLGVAFLGSAAIGIRRLPKESRVGLLLFTALIFAAFILFNVRYIQPQARYFFPALGPICLAAVLGAERVFKDRSRIAVGIFLLGLLGANVEAFARLPEGYAVRIGQLRQSVDAAKERKGP